MKEIPLSPLNSTIQNDGASLPWRRPVVVASSSSTVKPSPLKPSPSSTTSRIPVTSSSSSSGLSPTHVPDNTNDVFSDSSTEDFTFISETSLTMFPFWLTFRSSKQEYHYQWFRFNNNIKKLSVYVFIVLILLTGILTLTLDYEYTVYQKNPTYILIPILGRGIPLIVLLYITKYSQYWLPSPYSQSLGSKNFLSSSSFSSSRSSWGNRSGSFSPFIFPNYSGNLFGGSSLRRKGPSSSSSSSSIIGHGISSWSSSSGSLLYNHSNEHYNTNSFFCFSCIPYYSWYTYYLLFSLSLLSISISIQLIQCLHFQYMINTLSSHGTTDDFVYFTKYYTVPWAPLVYTVVLSILFTYTTNYYWWWCGIFTLINFGFCTGLVILPPYVYFQQHTTSSSNSNSNSIVTSSSSYLPSIIILWICVGIFLSFLNYQYDKFLRTLYRYHTVNKQKITVLSDKSIRTKINHRTNSIHTLHSLIHRTHMLILEINLQHGTIVYASPATKLITVPVSIQSSSSSSVNVSSVSSSTPSSIHSLYEPLSEDNSLYTNHSLYIHPDDRSFITSLQDQLLAYSQQYSLSLPTLRYNEINDDERTIRIQLRFRYQRKRIMVSPMDTAVPLVPPSTDHSSTDTLLSSLVYVEGEIHLIIPSPTIPLGSKRTVSVDQISCVYLLHRIDKPKHEPWKSGILSTTYPSNILHDLPIINGTTFPSSSSSSFSAAGSFDTTDVSSKESIYTPYDAHYMRSLYTALMLIEAKFTGMYAIVRSATNVWNQVLTITAANSTMNHGLGNSSHGANTTAPSVSSTFVSFDGLSRGNMSIISNPTELSSSALPMALDTTDPLNVPGMVHSNNNYNLPPTLSTLQLTSLSSEQKDTLLEIENALIALQDISNKGILLVEDTIALSRYRSQYLPVNPMIKINLRNTLSLAILSARRKIALIHLRRPQRIQLNISPTVPEVIQSDPVLIQALLDALLTSACEIARTGTIDVFISPGAPILLPIDSLNNGNNGTLTKHPLETILTASDGLHTTMDAAVPHRSTESIHFEVIFDANDVGGITAVANALSSDCLLIDQAYTNINPGNVDPRGYRSRHAMELIQSSTSFTILLPVVRHIVLCLGGTVSAGTGSIASENISTKDIISPTKVHDDFQGVNVSTPVLPFSVNEVTGIETTVPTRTSLSPTETNSSTDTNNSRNENLRIILQIDLPIPSLYRPLITGPSCVDSSIVMKNMQLSLLHLIPFPYEALKLTTTSSSLPVVASIVSSTIPSPTSPYNNNNNNNNNLFSTGILPTIPDGLVTPRSNDYTTGTKPPLPDVTENVSHVLPYSVHDRVAIDNNNAVRLDIPDTQGLRVLFVDDEQTNRFYGGKMLNKLGCFHTEIDDGDTVETMFRTAEERKESYDIILMDIYMARMNGNEACQLLRTLGYTKVVIIAMTGISNISTVADRTKLSSAGFDILLPKPFDLRAMKKALSDARIILRSRSG